ncbi:unnamed protein product [Schistosoma rodhaini]|uniref:SUN domain-containing protein n=1 Tax=Schistosoma rodhaini TaxID=6188 RepID=A0AA85FTT9_9TREM|nr:unnamed protein product [Schistosoma rodhaini]
MSLNNKIEVKHPIQLLKNLSPNFSINQKHKIYNKFMNSTHQNESITDIKGSHSNNSSSINNQQSYLQCTIDKTPFIMHDHHSNNTTFHIPYNHHHDHHHHHSISNLSELVKNNINNFPYEGYSQGKLNSNRINHQVDVNTSFNDTLKTISEEHLLQKSYSLQNVTSSNREIPKEDQSYSLSKYNYSSITTIPLQMNINSLKQMYQSKSTYVIVCKYPVNLSIRYLDNNNNNNQILNINLIQFNYLWHYVGWGYLVAIATKNYKLPNLYESIKLILCQPITFKQLWFGYIVIPDTMNHTTTTTTTTTNNNNNNNNTSLINHYIGQIYKHHSDKSFPTHYIIMKIIKDNEDDDDDDQSMEMGKKKPFKSPSILKFIFQKLFTTKTYKSKSSILINKQNYEYCICKIESLELGINKKIYQQSIEFFTELKKLIHNLIVFHFQSESEKQLPIEKRRHKDKLGVSTFPSNINSTECFKNQISFPCLFRHIYSLSRDDLQTIRTIYGFEV